MISVVGIERIYHGQRVVGSCADSSFVWVRYAVTGGTVKISRATWHALPEASPRASSVAWAHAITAAECHRAMAMNAAAPS